MIARDRRDGAGHPGGLLVVAAAYVALIAGTNLVNPLLPTYRQELDLSYSAVAAIFSVYLIVLIPLLAVFSFPRFQLPPRGALSVAIGLAVAANVAMSFATVPALVAGRVLSAVSIAVGTGAVATLALAVAGERARTTTATANVLGAVFGTVLAGLLISTPGLPTTAVFVAHSVVLGVVLALGLWTLGSRAVAERADGARPGEGAPRTIPAEVPPWAGIALGCVAWSAVAFVMVLAPAAYPSSSAASGLIAMVLIVGVLIPASVTQFWVPVSLVWGRRGLAALAVGLVLLGFGIGTGTLALAVAGSMTLGCGYGAVFKIGLTIATAGRWGPRQGAGASSYAMAAYAVAATSIVCGGLLADGLGDRVGVVVIVVTVATACVACAVVLRRFAPR